MSPEVLMTATLTAGTVPDTVSPAIRSRMMAGKRRNSQGFSQYETARPRGQAPYGFE